MVTDASLEESLQKTERLLAQKKPVASPFIIGIDGRCASGKTTFAAALSKRLGCDIIHLDDFFLQPCQRTSERYLEPGGNLDRERVLAEVLEPLEKQSQIVYGIFDCSSLSIHQNASARANPYLIVEGSYAFHPDLQPYYNLKIFVNIDSASQNQRIQTRNPQNFKAFMKRWIPLEEAYFQTLDPCALCDLVL